MTKNIKKNDILYVKFDGVGSEQKGVRPCIVLQNNVGNKFSKTTIVATITSQNKKDKQKTHVHINGYGLKKPSTIQFEQIHTIDESRILDKVGHVDNEDLLKEIKKAFLVSVDM